MIDRNTRDVSGVNQNQVNADPNRNDQTQDQAQRDAARTNPDGTPLRNPDGSTRNSDGSVTNADGTTTMPDGTIRYPKRDAVTGQPIKE